MTEQQKIEFPSADGTVYSKRKNFFPFSTPPIQAYASIISEKKMDRLMKGATSLEDL